jgi:tellurite resistance protein
MKKEYRIKHFPVSFFSIILGMAGFTIAFQKAEQILQMPIHLSWYILMMTILFFIIISIFYLTKIIRFKDDVKNEFNHPVKLSFFPAFSISLLLLSIAFLSINMLISKYLWISGAIIHLIFTIKIISIWIRHTKFEIKHMNPAWFIPAVGNILVPVAGVSHFSPEISWFFFSIGLFFWIALFIIFFNRIIFHNPLPDKLLPTLFILIAPPSVGFISLVKLTGEVNEFSKILYYFGLSIVFLLFAQINLFRKIKFYLSWWAYSFPMAAITIASILMFHETDIEVFKYLSWTFFFALSIIIILLLAKTAIAISKREMCIEEE